MNQKRHLKLYASRSTVLYIRLTVTYLLHLHVISTNV